MPKGAKLWFKNIKILLLYSLAGKNYWVAKLSQETVKGNQGNCSQIDSSKGNQSNKKDGPRIFKAAIISGGK